MLLWEIKTFLFSEILKQQQQQKHYVHSEDCIKDKHILKKGKHHFPENHLES